jgi:hypothetical protein
VTKFRLIPALALAALPALAACANEPEEGQGILREAPAAQGGDSLARPVALPATETQAAPTATPAPAPAAGAAQTPAGDTARADTAAADTGAAG